MHQIQRNNSLKRNFHVSPYVCAENIEVQKNYEIVFTFKTFHTFEFSLGPLKLGKNVNISDFKCLNKYHLLWFIKIY